MLLLEEALRELPRALRTRTPEERVVVDARAPEVAALEPRGEIELDQVAVEALRNKQQQLTKEEFITESVRATTLNE